MSSQSKTAQQPVSGKNADKVFKGVAYACGILILVVLAAVALFLLFRPRSRCSCCSARGR